MIRDATRRLWALPAAADPPVRVWRDWLLVAACLLAIGLEAVLRPGLTWRPVAVVVAAVAAAALPVRRTRPLLAVGVAFGPAVLLTVVSPWAGGEVGLGSSVFVLVLVYALFRWGSGRDVVLGTPLLLLAYGLGVTLGSVRSASDAIGGAVVLTFPAMLGSTLRAWTTSRARELDRVRSAERAQLARELHDTVAHHVSAMVIRAQAGRVLAAADPASAVEALAGVEEEGARTLEEMRAMVGALRDGAAELAPLGGVADLERLARTGAGRPRVEVRLEGGLAGLPAAVDAAVYRIVQESVTNAVRHAAGATAVRVRVVGEADRVLVTVRDDGAPAARGRGTPGYGLAGMRERAALLGGRFEAGAAGDGGWLVEAELPLRDRARGRLDRDRPRAGR